MRRMPLATLPRLVVLTVCLAACAGAPKLSDDARLVFRVEGLVASLARAYQEKAAQDLFAGMAPTLRDRETLRKTVEEVFARYDQIELTLSVDRVHLEGKTVTVFLHWDGRWRQSAHEPIIRQGTARFLVEDGEPPLLTDVVGENPFVPTPDVGSPS
jgi:hypothetical protein